MKFDSYSSYLIQLEFIRFNKIGYIHKHLSSNLIRFLLILFWEQLSSFWYRKVQKVSSTPTRFKMLEFTGQLPNGIMSLLFWLIYTLYHFFNYCGHFKITIKACCSLELSCTWEMLSGDHPVVRRMDTSWLSSSHF